MALFRGLLVLSLSCLQVPCLVFFPASAMELFGQQIVSGPTQEKLEPLSFLMLGNQVQTGAQNQTLQRLQQVLHADSGPCLPHLLSRLCQDLGPGAFRLAARMYLQKGFPIKEDFLKQSEQLFGAKPMNLMGKKGDDLANINQWVKEATEGKIEDFLSELSDDTVLLLLNAIHFQGFWRSKFDPSLTQRETFHLDEQFTVPVDMMQARTYPLRWFLLEQPEIQVAHFPFKNNMSFVVIVPTYFEWNVSQVLANLSWDILHQPLLRERPTKVQLPKLHLKYQLDLVATLSQLGLQELFQAPDLRGISDQSLVVSSVQHQSTLELSEAGVEAAAATSSAMSRMSLSSFSVNRPFLFFILEDTTSLPLFVGSVRNPNPGAQRERKEQQDSPVNRDSLQNQKAFPRGDKPFGPDLKLTPPSEEDYPQPNSPK
uniref:Serpin family F member 1 n=1 Tax=Rousettus aegyptiacus TaxID=9407 RepID=A0A7J8GFM1_ROUAE|nr:serpin family F member 1 [Rousettus aegyptiacus]